MNGTSVRGSFGSIIGLRRLKQWVYVSLGLQPGRVDLVVGATFGFLITGATASQRSSRTAIFNMVPTRTRWFVTVFGVRCARSRLYVSKSGGAELAQEL